MQGILVTDLGSLKLVNLNNQAIDILGCRLHLGTSATKKSYLNFPPHILLWTQILRNTNTHRWS